MKKVIRLTEHDLQRIIKRVIREKNNQSKLNEDLTDDLWNAGKQAVDTVGKAAGKAIDAGGKVADKAIEAGEKYLALKSDWWYLTPLAGVKLTYDEVRALRAMQKQTFEQTMEGIRDVAGGVKGVVIAVALDAAGVGAVINPVFWGLFAVYDIWLWAEKGILNLFNIIMDIISVATAGVGAAFVKGFKSILGPVAKSGTAKFVSVMAKKAPKLFEYLAKLMKNSSGIISKISSQAAIGIKELSKRLPFMTKGLQSMKSGINTLKGFMTQLEKAISHEMVHFGKHILKHKAEHKIADAAVSSVVGKEPQTIPRYIAVNGVKKPNPKFKQKYGYA